MREIVVTSEYLAWPGLAWHCMAWLDLTSFPFPFLAIFVGSIPARASSNPRNTVALEVGEGIANLDRLLYCSF